MVSEGGNNPLLTGKFPIDSEVVTLSILWHATRNAKSTVLAIPKKCERRVSSVSVVSRPPVLVERAD